MIVTNANTEEFKTKLRTLLEKTFDTHKRKVGDHWCNEDALIDYRFEDAAVEVLKELGVVPPDFTL